MLRKLVFYNIWHTGDLFMSREFVKEIMKQVPSEEYCYAHNQNLRTFSDISLLKNILPTDVMDPQKGIFQLGDCLYINTHNHARYLCTVESYWEMYNSYLKRLGLSLSKKPLEFLPEIDYSKFEIGGVNRFISEHDEEKILICNGDVLSNQAENFNFAPVIDKLAATYPEKSFIITKDIQNKQPNVYFTGNITETSDGFDLYEISYLSTFCNIIIGRFSGPHTCAQTKQNYFDPKKILITFTYGEYGNTFVWGEDTPMKRIWSSATKEIPVYNEIMEVMENR